MTAFDLLDVVLDARAIREDNAPVCSCKDCYTDKDGVDRCRCDYCRPALPKAKR